MNSPLPIDIDTADKVRELFDQHSRVLSRLEWELNWLLEQLTTTDEDANDWREAAHRAWTKVHESDHRRHEGEDPVRDPAGGD